MKNLLFVFATLVMFSNPVWAQTQQPALITVSGSAEIRVVPNEVILNVGVETRNANLAAGKKDNDAQIAAGLDFLKEQGVEGKNIQTDYLNIQPCYENNNTTIIAYYNVTKNIVIRLTTVTNLEPILTGLLSRGVNQVGGINFCTTELRKYRDEARIKAFHAAKEKAQALAAEAGVKLGKINNISTYDIGGWGGMSGRWAMNNLTINGMSNGSNLPDVSGAFASGQISVSATVNASYLIE
jgi:uncharacterized protein